MRQTLVCIVEGHGETDAVPLLIRRVALEFQQHNLEVPPPIRCPKSKIVRPGETVNRQELERAIKLATWKLPSPREGAILVLLDADDDCPAVIGPEIVAIAREVRSDVFVKAVIAKREYEAWFVAAIESLRGRRGIREDAVRHPAPESLSDPKGYLSRQMPGNQKYSERLDQPALTSVFDLSQADTCASFRKFRRDIKEIFDHLFGIRGA